MVMMSMMVMMVMMIVKILVILTMTMMMTMVLMTSLYCLVSAVQLALHCDTATKSSGHSANTKQMIAPAHFRRTIVPCLPTDSQAHVTTTHTTYANAQTRSYNGLL